jgi:hypothetical protein
MNNKDATVFTNKEDLPGVTIRHFSGKVVNNELTLKIP